MSFLLNLSFCFLIGLVLYSPASLGQSVPNPTDTSYIMSLLKKAEAIEMQQPETALQSYQKALEFSQKIGYTKGYFDSLRLLTYLLDMIGRHADSEKMAQEGLEKALRDTCEQYKSNCYFALAQSVRMQGRNKDAIHYYKKAAPYMLAHKNPKKAAVLYQNLGLVYEQERLYPQALTYYNRAVESDLKANSSNQELAIDYHSIASVSVKQHQLKKAMTYYQKAKSMLDSTQDRHFLVDLYSNIANLQKELMDYDSSLYYYAEALRMNRELNNPLQKLHLLAGQAETYNVMKQYVKAGSLLDEAHRLAKKNKVGLSEFRNIYREYTNTSIGVGKYKEALDWYDKYVNTKDSLSTIEAKELLEEYEVKLKEAEASKKLAEKQLHIDQLQEKQARQNLWFLIAGLVLLVVVGGLFFAYFYTRQRQRTADNALLAAQRERELAMVQSELQGQQKERLRISKEMHDDLGASLTAIGLLSEVVKKRMGTQTTPEVEKISSISADMVTTMNEIIWSLNTKNDSLNGLIAYTRAYASEFIENTSIRLKTNVTESDQEIAMRGVDRRNVFLTVKEALNNVVKHAQATEVTLTIRPEADQLFIEVRDNGRGFEPSEKMTLRNGLGNMRQRIADSGGRCEILPSSTGTSVQITYPYPSVPVTKIMQT